MSNKQIPRLQVFLRSKRCYEPLQDMSISNNDLSGGVLYIKDEHYEKFLHVYTNEITLGSELYLTERLSPVFSFFLDVDMKFDVVDSHDLPKNECWASLFGEIIGVLHRFYPNVDSKERNELFKCVITSAPNKVLQNTRTGESQMKVGFHLHFPNLKVTSEQALYIHASVVSFLEATLNMSGPFKCMLTPWNDAVDPVVFRHGTGLRMLGSDKCSECKQCRSNSNKQVQVCTSCLGKGPRPGKISEGRVYTLWSVLNGDVSIYTSVNNLSGVGSAAA